MKKILSIAVLLLVIIAGCKKIDFAGNDQTGEGLVEFGLKLPASGTNVVLNAATPDAKVNFSWNAARPGLYAAPVYSIVMALKNGGDINQPYITLPVTGNNPSADISHQQLDDALKAKGIGNGVKTDLVWSVKADNGSTNILSQTVFNISITRMQDGATPFYLLGPASSLSAIETSPTSTTDMLKFNWTRSKPAAGGGAITYKVVFAKRVLDSDGNEVPVDWTTGTLFSISSNNSGADSLMTISHKAYNDSLVKYGYTDYGQQVNLKWAVIASSGTWSQLSAYVNTVSVSRLIKYNYPQALNVAGSFQGWDPPTAPQLVALTPAGGPYSEYVGFFDFGANAPEFKIVKGDNWGAGDYGMVNSTTIGNGGSNFTLPSGGVFLMKVNTTAMSWSATKVNSVGIIGDATGSWDNEQNMTYNAAEKKWSITLNLVPGAIKFRINNGWDINLGDYGPDGMLEFNGDNIAVAAAGNYTVSVSILNGGNWRYTVSRN